MPGHSRFTTQSETDRYCLQNKSLRRRSCAKASPLTQQQKQYTKDHLNLDETDRDPYVLIQPILEESKLASISRQLELCTIDGEENMPFNTISNNSCLWDTGARTSFITKDLLSAEFCSLWHTQGLPSPSRWPKPTSSIQLSNAPLTNRCYVQAELHFSHLFPVIVYYKHDLRVIRIRISAGLISLARAAVRRGVREGRVVQIVNAVASHGGR